MSEPLRFVAEHRLGAAAAATAALLVAAIVAAVVAFGGNGDEPATARTQTTASPTQTAVRTRTPIATRTTTGTPRGTATPNAATTTPRAQATQASTERPPAAAPTATSRPQPRPTQPRPSPTRPPAAPSPTQQQPVTIRIVSPAADATVGATFKLEVAVTGVELALGPNDELIPGAAHWHVTVDGDPLPGVYDEPSAQVGPLSAGSYTLAVTLYLNEADFMAIATDLVTITVNP